MKREGHGYLTGKKKKEKDMIDIYVHYHFSMDKWIMEVGMWSQPLSYSREEENRCYTHHQQRWAKCKSGEVHSSNKKYTRDNKN